MIIMQHYKQPNKNDFVKGARHIREFVETQLEHCKKQIERCKKEDPDSTIDWLARECAFKNVLDELDKTFTL